MELPGYITGYCCCPPPYGYMPGVTVRENQGLGTAITTDNGAFLMSLPAGTYNITAMKVLPNGYTAIGGANGITITAGGSVSVGVIYLY